MASPVVSDILSFAARQGNEVLREQVELGSALWNELEHETMEGQIAVVNVIDAGQSSAKWIKDGGTRSTGSGNTPVQGQVSASFVDAPLVLNNGVLMTLKAKKDAANYMDQQLKQAGKTLAQTIGSGFFGTSGLIAEVDEVPSTLKFRVSSISGFKEGMAYELKQDGYSYTLRCDVVEFVPGVSDFDGYLTFVDDVPGITRANLAALPAFTATAQIYARGTHDPATIDLTSARMAALGTAGSSVAASSVCVDLQTITSASATLHGLASTVWRGNSFDSIGTFTQADAIGHARKVKLIAGEVPDLLVCGVMDFSALAASGIAASTDFGHSSTQPRKNVDGSLDKYGKGIMGNSFSVAGMKVIEDNNLADGTAYGINTDNLKIGVWQDIEAEKQGGDTLLIHQDQFSKVAFFNAALNLICNKRNAHMKLGGITTTL